MPHEIAKKAAAASALAYIKEGDTVGLGTGSTVYFLLKELGKLSRSGFSIKATSTSKATEEIALAEGIPLFPLDEIFPLTLSIDGADELDLELNLIKGGGGALLREKIVASSSKKRLIIADSSKLKGQLGSFPLPVEIALFGCLSTVSRLEEAGFSGSLRKTKEGNLFLSDNGNPIFDLKSQEVKEPKKLEERLKGIPGVLEVGLFLNLTDIALIGSENGSVKLVSKEKS